MGKKVVPFRLSPFSALRLSSSFADSLAAELRALVRSESEEIAERFEVYRKAGVLELDAEPGFYLAEQTFTLPGDPLSARGTAGVELTRRSVIGALSLSEESRGRVLPHERVFESQVEERVEQFRACPYDLDPVMLFSDATDSAGSTGMARLFQAIEASDTPPVLELSADLPSPGAVHYRLWRLTEPMLSRLAPLALHEFQGGFENRDLFIADGHHRFEAAVRFQAENGDHQLMVAIAASDDPGLVIRPTHRLVRSTSFSDLSELLGALRAEVVWKGGIDKGLTRLKWLKGVRRTFGAYDGNEFAVLGELEDPDGFPDSGGASNQALEEAHTDTAFLRRELIELALGFGLKDIENQIEFTEDTAGARAKVESGEFQFAFFLNPVSVAEVAHEAKAGRRFPQKATCFFPKPLKGVIFRPIQTQVKGDGSGK